MELNALVEAVITNRRIFLRENPIGQRAKKVTKKSTKKVTKRTKRTIKTLTYEQACIELERRLREEGQK